MPDTNYKWHRLEPRPRSHTIEKNLAARVRDPLWFLARQWQFGEFQGEDAASPSYIDLKARFSPIDHWKSLDDKKFRSYDKGQIPFEAQVTAEPFEPDWTIAVEIGQQFEAILKENNKENILDGFVEDFRKSYLIPESKNDDTVENDLELDRFMLLCRGRTIDGIKLSEDVQNVAKRQKLLDELSLEVRQVLIKVIDEFTEWVNLVFGDLRLANLQNLSQDDPITWRPERLEYQVEVSAHVYEKEQKLSTQGKQIQFAAYPERDGTFDWYAFDQKLDQVEKGKSSPLQTISVLPSYVRFTGMPNKRWWKFENRLINFPRMQTGLVELPKAILIDFMLNYSNDWFFVPFAQEIGTICQIDTLEVHDVFGGSTVIQRAEEVDRQILGLEDYNKLRPSERWSMFSITSENRGELADLFVMPPSAATTILSGETLEDVRFVRDEMANMVWAIEHTIENQVGMPLLRHENGGAKQPDSNEKVASAPDAPLKYQLQTTVPDYWIPFLPVRVNQIKRDDETNRDIALERAAMLDRQEQAIHPKGRILKPTRLKASIHDWENNKKVYRIREEEIPRTGISVTRVVQRSRWINGSTHIWITRRKRTGRGEGRSGLSFDDAIPTQTSDDSQ